ncbi:hypothetical protein JCM33374_g2860 [Metschnikowia sp. JCM 33374]|nr:hypothetical protein JCM33374_g2860 [Metschnikowia sp. JCM 33374]
MKIIPALIPKPRLLPPLRTSGGIFDFAIYYSATVISVTKNGHTFVNGKLNRTPSDDPQSKGTEKTSIVLHFSKLGAESFAESRENARLLVDLLDVCGDEWQVESCHICIPKHSKHCHSKPGFASKKVSLDRELPDPFADKKKNIKYFWAYAVGVTVSCVIIFNYEKTQSPIINSVLYCLRRSEAAKQALGPNIGYASSWPWISGELNTVQGNIDVEFKVKGDTDKAMLKMKANRESKLVPFAVKHLFLEFPMAKESI